MYFFFRSYDIFSLVHTPSILRLSTFRNRAKCMEHLRKRKKNELFAYYNILNIALKKQIINLYRTLNSMFKVQLLRESIKRSN